MNVFRLLIAPTQNTWSYPAVPVRGTKRGASIPVPPPVTAGNNDKEWDAPDKGASGLINAGGYYLVTITYRQSSTGNIRKTLTQFSEVTQAAWEQRLKEWTQEVLMQGSTTRVMEDVPELDPAPVPAMEEAPAAHAAEAPTNTQAPAATTTTDANHTLPQGWTASNGYINPTHTHTPQVPAKLTNYYPQTEVWKILDVAAKIGQAEGEPKNAIIYGDAATGKTSAVEQWCATRKRKMALIDLAAANDPLQLTGSLALRGGTTAYIPSDLVNAIVDPECDTICLDEINRVSNPTVTNMLMQLLDHRRKLYLSDLGLAVKLSGPKLIICTQNGPLKGSNQAQYSGTQSLDEALLSRLVPRIKMTYPSTARLTAIIQKSTKIAREYAELLAKLATELNDHHYHQPNLRELITAAQYVLEGMPLDQALDITIAPIYDDGQGAAGLKTTYLTKLRGLQIPTTDPNTTPDDTEDSYLNG